MREPSNEPRKKTICPPGRLTAAARVSACLALLVFGPPAARAAEPALSDERLKAAVKEVIRDNPELIMETLNKYQEQQQKKRQEAQLDESFKNRLKDTVSKDHPAVGPPDAPVTIIEYTDFQCPYCAKGAQTVKEVQRMYPDKVRVVFKNLPLKMHDQAEPAARAALAAHNQGKFWEYHDLLFQNGSRLNSETYAELAGKLGLDVAKFRADMGAEATTARIKADMQQAEALKLNGTPRFLVNGVEIRGAYPPDHFARVIDRLLAEKKKS